MHQTDAVDQFEVYWRGGSAWIIAEACRRHQHWRRAGIGAPPVSINLSAVQLREPGLCAMLEAGLRQYAVDPAQVELELTKSILMEAGLEPHAQMLALLFLMEGTGS